MAKFTFPPLTELKPGQIVRVYTNEDHPESGGYSFDRGIQIWNNKGGKGMLKDDTGKEISQFVYPVLTEAEKIEKQAELQEKIAKTKEQLEEARLERKRLRKIWDELKVLNANPPSNKKEQQEFRRRFKAAAKEFDLASDEEKALRKALNNLKSQLE